MSSNDKKNETLGMSHGTATHRLRKMVLFRQLEKHKENVCIRCNKVIESVDELSIEHIKPWQGISADLFWDLDNVSFSHMACNRPHRTDFNRISVPLGTSWCCSCQKPLPISEFYKQSRTYDGLDKYCKECKRKKDIRPNHAKKVELF